jgi:hypothetical protein
MLVIREVEAEDCPSIANVHTSAVKAISANLQAPEEIEEGRSHASLKTIDRPLHEKF